jgi:hypothetical protein
MTVRSRTFALAALAAFTPIFAAPPQLTYEKPVDQVFVYDNAEYTLRDNGTWTCKGKGCRVSSEDFTIDLSDGRTIVFALDSTWHPFVKGELVGTKDINVREASVTTSSTSIRVDLAEQKADKDARQKLAAKIVAGAPRRKLTTAKVLWCMNDQRLFPTVEKKRDAKGNWTASAAISVKWAQVFNLITCAEQLVVDTAAATADTTKK